ncbi:hypothetical protein HCA55_11375 [Listeria booriae]|uniref:Uncharacterized protein n=1 Tax=Listeria booriae TaxID=1552123 RepID=A0A842B4L5_9LIST|nr:hypothetical protein [Listeria booriae]MBC1797328.1 hypothetical protein [Listeria booriae]MBC1811911.1 hypothetical protein [Listeria booriae]
MNHKTVKLITPVMGLSLLLSTLAPVIPVSANETNESAVEEAASQYALTDVDIGIANQYITLNATSNNFSVSPSISNVLSSEKVNIINAFVATANTFIKTAKMDISMPIYAIDPSTGKGVLLNHVATLRSAGKNDITLHWNYARIYLNAENTRLAAMGSVGGIGGLITAATSSVGVGVFVGAVSGILGYKASGIKDGTWWDVNFFTTSITKWGWQ